MKWSVSFKISMLFLFILVFVGCRLNRDIVGTTENAQVQPPGLPSTSAPLSITNDSAQKMGSTLEILPSGGTPPYSFEMVSGSGTIDSNGRLEIGWSLSPIEIKVTDSEGEEVTFSVSVSGGKVSPAPQSSGGFQLWSLPYICPSTQKLYFLGEIDEAGVKELYESDPNGENFRKINSALVAGGNVNNFMLTPDCQNLFYVADQVIDNVLDVFSVNLNVGTPVNLSNLTLGNLNLRDYSPTLNKATVTGNTDGTFKSELFTVTMGVSDSLVQISDNLAADFPGVYEGYFMYDDTTVIYSGTQFNATEKHVHTINLSPLSGITQISDNGTGAWTIFMPQEIGNSGTIVYGSQVLGDCLLYGGQAHVAGSTDLVSAGLKFDSLFCNDFVSVSDGSKIYYPALNTGASTKAIYSSSTSVQGSTQVTPSFASAGSLFKNLKLSSDESTLYFLGVLPLATGTQLYKVATSGGSAIQISNTNDVQSDYLLNSDQSKVFYRSGSPSSYALYVANTDGTGIPLKLSTVDDVSAFKVLSNKVVFLMKTEPSDPYELYSIDFDGTHLKKISQSIVAGGTILTFSVTDDEKCILYGGDLDVDGKYEYYFTSIE